jgi:hypothetical protein
MYIYQADVWCDDCGRAIRSGLLLAGKAPENIEDESSYDSDDFPKGPYSDNEESDTPQHCASGEDCPNHETLDDGRKVGMLFGSLTSDGVEYVQQCEDSPCVRLWREHFDL